jgi:hypothetical protein
LERPLTEGAVSPDQIVASVEDPMVLVKMGIEAAREERWSAGVALLAAAYERLTKRGDLKSLDAAGASGTAGLKDVVPGSALAYYGLCLAMDRGNYTEGAKFVQIAIHIEPVVGEHYFVLAKLWKHARSRRKMVEAIQRGVAASPRYAPLRRLANEVGIRRGAVIPFLPRESTLNKALGKFRHRIMQSRKQRARDEAARKETAAASSSPLRPPPGARPEEGDPLAPRRPSKV